MAPKKQKKVAPPTPARAVPKKKKKIIEVKPDFFGRGGHKRRAENVASWRMTGAEVHAALTDVLPRNPSGSVTTVPSAARPITYDAGVGGLICGMFATDPRMSLARLNAMPDMPTVFTFYEWLDAHPDLNRQYVRAREVHADLQAEELRDITRAPLRGEVRVTRSGTNADGSTFDSEEVRVIDNVDRARLIVDTDKWILSKLRPKKYGIQPVESDAGGGGLSDLLNQFRARSKELENEPE